MDERDSTIEDEGSVEDDTCVKCRNPSSHKAHTCGRKKRKTADGPQHMQAEERGKAEDRKDCMEYDLVETSLVPLGTGYDVMDRITVMRTMRRAWFNRPGINRDGPWNRNYTMKMLDNKDICTQLATNFGRALEDSGTVRELFKSDVPDKPIEVLRDSVADVINTMLATNEASELDKPGGEATSTWMPGYNRNPAADQLLHGPDEGGLDGRHEVLLWKLSTDESSGCTSMIMDRDIIAIATQLAQAKHTSDLPPGAMLFGMPCAQAKFKMGAGRKAHCSVSYTPAHPEPQYIMPSHSLSDTLLQRVAEYRCSDLGIDIADGVPDLPGGINDPAIMRGISQASEREEQAHSGTREIISSQLFDIVLWTDIISGIDEKGNARRIRMDAVILRMTTPGADGGLLLDSMRQCMPCFVEPLMRILSHMSLVLGSRSELQMQELFDTPNNVLSGHICSLSEPGHLMLAVFLFARRTGTHNVQWQGVRIDVDNEAEVRLYRAYIQETVLARAQHYAIVKAACDVWSSGRRPREIPMMQEFGVKNTELFDGFHYVFEEEAVLDEYMERVISLHASDAVVANEFHKQYEKFRESCIISTEKVGGVMRRYVYWPEAGNLPRSSGVMARINMDMVKRFDANAYRGDKSALTYRPLFDIRRMSPMLEIWMKRAIESGKDAFDMFFTKSDYICDKRWLTLQEAKLPPELRELFMFLRKGLLFAKDAQRLTEEALFTSDVLKLYGAHTHPIREMLSNSIRSSPVEELSRVLRNTIYYNTAEALSMMENGVLVQMRAAAQSMRSDMRLQGDTNAEMFLKHWEGVERGMLPPDSQRTDLGALELANDGARAALFRNYHRKRLQLDLSFQNELFAEMIADSTIAMMMHMSKVWGVPLKVADGAMANIVLRRTSHERRETMWDMKSPGCGVDCLINHRGGEDLAFGRYLSRQLHLRRFFSNKSNKDVISQKITPYAMSKYLGCGLQFTSQGHIDRKDDNFLEQAFLTGYLTEGRKINAGSTDSEDAAGVLECFIGESGIGDNAQKFGWVTTTQHSTTKVTQVIRAGSVAVVCNNRVEPAFPSSSLEGARFSFVHAAVLCKKVGVYTNITRDERASEAKGSMVLETLEADDRGKIKDIDEHITEQFAGYFLWRHLCRKCLPLLLRVLTSEPVRENYVHSMNARRLGNSWRLLTRGVRRHFMRDDNVANRTLNGPWECSNLLPEWIKRVVLEACMRAFETPRERPGREPSIDLGGIAEDCVSRVIFAPIDIYTYLNSMLMFTSQKALDMNVMIVSCFQLSVLGFHFYCPLEVIALVMRNEPLSNVQQKQYEGLCQFLKSILVPPRNTTRGLVHSGWMQTHTKATIQDWAHFHVPENVHIVQNAHQELSGMPSQMLTCFVRPRLEFVTRETPEWLLKPTAGRPSKMDTRRNDFATETMSSMVAELWAGQHTPDECRRRQRAAAAAGTPLPPHERVSDIWRSAVAGTRLPSELHQGKSNDKHHFSFDTQNHSGHYFERVAENSEEMMGLYLHVLQLCDLTRETSRADFFSRLFARSEAQGMPDFSSEEFDNDYWRSAIASDAERIAPFRWGVMPHVSRNHSGFDMVDGVETVLGTDILWLVIAQALFCREWHTLVRSGDGLTRGDRRSGPRRARQQSASGAQVATDSNGPWQTVIHLRNLTSATEVLLMLMLHLHVEKAAIPVAISNGASMRIILNQQCADLEMRQHNGSIVYDPRLHLDSYDEAQNFDARHLLSMRARRPQSFRVVFLEDCGRVNLYYNSILRDMDTTWSPHVVGDLHVFPPESYYHMHTHARLLRHATQALLERQPALATHPQAAFVLAHQLFGLSATTASMRFVPSTLTQAAVEDEIPCLCLQHGFMLSLVAAGGSKFRVQPTEPTHSINFGDTMCAALARQHGLGELRALPLAGHRLCAASKLGVLACGGLLFEEGSDAVRLDSALLGTADTPSKATTKADEDRIPFTYFPIALWTQLVFLEPTHKCRTDRDGRVWRVANAETELAACAAFELSAAAVAFWLRTQTSEVILCTDDVRILAPDALIREEYETAAAAPDESRGDVPDDDMFVFAVRYSGFVWWFNNRAALRVALQRNQGLPCSTEDVQRRALGGDFLVDGLYAPERVRAPALYAAFEDAEDTDELLTVPMVDFDDFEYNRLERKCAALWDQVRAGRKLVADGEHELSAIDARLGIESSSICQTPTRQFIGTVNDADSLRTSGEDERRRQEMLSRLQHKRERVAVREHEASVLQASLDACKIDRSASTVVQLERSAPATQGLAPLRSLQQPTPAAGMEMDKDERQPPIAALTVLWDDGKWLRRGRYRAVYNDGAGMREMPLDFVSHSLCMVSEGTPVFVRVSPVLYLSIREHLPMLFVNDADLHDTMCDEMSDIEFYLQVFYVLGARVFSGVDSQNIAVRTLIGTMSDDGEEDNLDAWKLEEFSCPVYEELDDSCGVTRTVSRIVPAPPPTAKVFRVLNFADELLEA